MFKLISIFVDGLVNWAIIHLAEALLLARAWKGTVIWLFRSILCDLAVNFISRLHDIGHKEHALFSPVSGDLRYVFFPTVNT